MEDSDRFRCQICGQVPEKPHHYNPFLCTNCGMLVCDKCHNEQKHVHPRSAEELFREAHAPKQQPTKRTFISTTGSVDDTDTPF